MKKILSIIFLVLSLALLSSVAFAESELETEDDSESSSSEQTNTENTEADTLIEKEKTVKPRTRASAKKTIEKLKANNKNPIESNDTSRDTKMGKKGWWDR